LPAISSIFCAADHGEKFAACAAATSDVALTKAASNTTLDTATLPLRLLAPVIAVLLSRRIFHRRA
jgi:hypothetical protein